MFVSIFDEDLFVFLNHLPKRRERMFRVNWRSTDGRIFVRSVPREKRLRRRGGRDILNGREKATGFDEEKQSSLTDIRGTKIFEKEDID